MFEFLLIADMGTENDVLFGATTWVVILSIFALMPLFAYVLAYKKSKAGKNRPKLWPILVYFLVLIVCVTFSSEPAWGFGAVVLFAAAGLPLGVWTFSRTEKASG